MTACVRATRVHLEQRPEEVEATVSSLMAQTMPGVPEPSEEEATNQFFSLSVLACYEAIDNKTVSQVLSDGKLAEDAAEVVFGNVLSSRRPTRQQVELYETVVQEEQARLLEQLTPDDMPGAIGNIGRKMSPATKAAYVAFVLTGLVAFGAWSLWHMTREKPQKERSSKSWRNEMKTARMEKKRR
ncbi:unnamed protein product [Effrenium voratum]|nr:unnamed protein product [Effrenium voratum]